MTILEVVKELVEQGHEVSYSKRKDGGYRITRIDGKYYSGSSGNVLARTIVGTTLSEARARQLAKIKTPKGRYDKRRKAPLGKKIEKEIRRLQRMYKKAGKKEGFPTRRNYRYILENRGRREANRLLRQAERRILGLAYPENVDWLLAKLKRIVDRIPANALKRAIQKIREKKYDFRQSWLNAIYELPANHSDLEVAVGTGEFSAEELGQKILEIIS